MMQEEMMQKEDTTMIQEENTAIKYEDSGIDARIVRAVKEMGYEEMTPIQQMTIPALLEGKDIIGQAQTGTGKTAAFGIPIVQAMDPENDNVQAIILCPTRELAIQAAEEIRNFAKFMHGIKVLPIYGGQDIEKQIRSLRSNVTIVVGTPGRVLDHMRRHTLKLDHVKMVILDEADEMLNMGFRESIEDVLAAIPEEHQTGLFSATMPQAILDITSQYQHDAVTIKVARKELTIPLVKQYYYEVKRQNKEEVVSRLLDYYNPKLSLIFCNTKRMVDELSDHLKGRGYFAEGLHGDMSQAQRDKVMRGFRNGTVEILIATDVAARGLDVDDVEAVFNYDIPQDIEYYVHRIGRTGRAGRKGRSFTLVVGKEIYRIRDIERLCNTKVTARLVPSVADINEAKFQKVFAEVMEVINQNDLTELVNLVQDKMNDEDITALDLCAAFLQLHLGEKKEDIPEESYFKERDARRKGSSEGRYGNRRNENARSEGNERKGGKRWEGRRGGDGEKRSYEGKRDFGEKRSYEGKRDFGEKRSYEGKRDFGEKRSYEGKRDFGEKRSYEGKRDFGEKRSFEGKKDFGEKRSFEGKRKFGEKKEFTEGKRDFKEKQEYKEGKSEQIRSKKNNPMKKFAQKATQPISKKLNINKKDVKAKDIDNKTGLLKEQIGTGNSKNFIKRR